VGGCGSGFGGEIEVLAAGLQKREDVVEKPEWADESGE
jgi:hypothetical protein